MDFTHNSISKYGREKKTKKINKVMDNILNEYCLKRSTFNPAKKSPNFFLTKLQHRMKLYYSIMKSSD